MDVAAVVAALLLAGVAVVQVALALGAPFGDHVYGGRAKTHDGVLETRYRVMSAIAVPILIFAALVVLSRAEVVSTFGVSGWVTVATWVVFGYLVLNIVGNLASSSRIERLGMGAVTVIAAAATLVVALG